MTKEEIIRDTFLFYDSDPSRRAVDEEGSCTYRTEDGRNCAFGRYMKEEYLKNECCEIYGMGISSDYTDNTLVGMLEVDNHDELLIEKVQGHPLHFWKELQSLHDREYYWSENGITEKGYDYLMKLANKYEEN